MCYRPTTWVSGGGGEGGNVLYHVGVEEGSNVLYHVGVGGGK